MLEPARKAVRAPSWSRNARRACPSERRSVIDATLGRSSAAIAQLVEAGLVQRRGDRLWMHRLFRRHAVIRGEIDGVDAEAVLRSALTWLLAGASAADLAKMGAGRYRCTPVQELATREFADAEQAVLDAGGLDLHPVG